MKPQDPSAPSVSFPSSAATASPARAASPASHASATVPAPAPRETACATTASPPVQANFPRFSDLWSGYPEGHPDESRWPEDVVDRGVLVARKGELKYPDQCAIKVCVALHAAGIDLAGFRGATTVIDGKRMALRAMELAAWLDQQPWARAALRMTGATWQERAAGCTGIIYFANYWRRAGETAPTGDHIDLWRHDTLTPSMQSLLRFRLGIHHLPNPLDLLRGKSGNWYSDLNGATEVVLWQID